MRSDPPFPQKVDHHHHGVSPDEALRTLRELTWKAEEYVLTRRSIPGNVVVGEVVRFVQNGIQKYVARFKVNGLEHTATVELEDQELLLTPPNHFYEKVCRTLAEAIATELMPSFAHVLATKEKP